MLIIPPSRSAGPAKGAGVRKFVKFIKFKSGEAGASLFCFLVPLEKGVLGGFIILKVSDHFVIPAPSSAG